MGASSKRASSGGAKGALEALLQRALCASDGGIRGVVQGDAAQVEASLVAVVLRVALSAALGVAGTTSAAVGSAAAPGFAGTTSAAVGSAAAPGLPASCRSVSELAAALRASEEWLRAAGARSRLLVGPPTSLLDTTDALGRWLDDETVASVFSSLAVDSAPIDHARVSSLYEELLSLRVRRVSGVAVALRPGGAWVVTSDVVAQAPMLRSKWLQRTFGLPKSAVEQLASALARAETPDEMAEALAPLCLRNRRAAPGALVVDESHERRRSGSHYTPPSLAQKVVARALAPLVEGASSAAIRTLHVCDPAMGSGAFLEPAAQFLATALARAQRTEAASTPPDASIDRDAMRTVVVECLYGVDKDPVATDLARARLAALVTQPGPPPPDLSRHLKTGDALVGTVRVEARRSLPSAAQDASLRPPRALAPFHWSTEFADVFAQSDGFDACVGNPPWVAYVGRAAQPLAPALADYYETTNPAFRAYRTLHGLFVRRAAELLRSGGRLGLVLPTSVADLSGYGPTRDAHDALCDVDPELIDFGDGAFEGVFQPCMALTSTRRRAPTPASVERSRDSTERSRDSTERPRGSIWQLARTDLEPVAARLLERLEALPKLASELFGERGFQTTGDDLAHLRKLAGPSPPFVVPIHEGADVAEFRTEPPRTYLDPQGLRGRLRDAADFRAVGVLIRQTARYPIASVSDGVAFRNSVLAGFTNHAWSAPALAAYLNASLVRFYHFARHRDARQGMPQLKIGHLRALPDVPDATTRGKLHALGESLSRANAGIPTAERQQLDDIVAVAFDLRPSERDMVQKWALENPLPISRRERIATDVATNERTGARGAR
ncbi:MAG TPA: hypothetical protein VHC69_01075 [Polyangiaceae bacterium]|nr:hypothetical protein [Polyangiaceae bacterium]